MLGILYLDGRNMKPSDETIEKFQRLYFEEFGEKISREEAYDKFLRLVNFLRAIFYPESGQEVQPPDSQFDVDSKNGRV
jgi:hypothetical protein